MIKATHNSSSSNRNNVILAGMTLGASAVLLASAAMAHNNEVLITERGNQRCIQSNGLPDHSTGAFPRRGNPHQIQAQSVRLCVAKNPRKSNRARAVRGSIGVALNGVQIRPGTADWYDPSSRRGHSRDHSSGWNLEGMGAKTMLGMDKNNAHVDQRGLYHYHGVSRALTRQGKGTLIGYAADGFEIHYVGNKQKASYQLKQGTRPSAPGGRYDGTYVQDWIFQPGSGSLDQCNGGELNGRFVYFATDSYPFFPRCLWGSISSDFERGRSADRGQGGQTPQGRPSRPDRPDTFQQKSSQMKGQHQGIGVQDNRQARRTGPTGFGPPQEAITACQNKGPGQNCEIQTPHGHQINGTCGQTRSGQRACMPQGQRPPRR